jgi:hypothetical protein
MSFVEDRLQIERIKRSTTFNARIKEQACWNYVLSQETASGSRFLVARPGDEVYYFIGLTNQVVHLPKGGRGADAFFAYLHQRYGLPERDKTTELVYDTARLYAYQHGSLVDMRRFALWHLEQKCAYVSRYDGTMWRLDGSGTFEVKPNGTDDVFFIDDDGGMPATGVEFGEHGELLPKLTDLSFSSTAPGGITAEDQKRALIIWILSLAFPDIMPTKPLLLLEGSQGSGKCLQRGTLVMRHDGTLVPVEDVQVGDQLMGPDSQPRNVLSTTTGRGELYRVTPTKGEPWVCNDAHVLTLVRSHSDKVVDVPIQEYATKAAASKSYRLEHLLFTTAIDFPPRAEPLPIDPYFLGVWYGDGTKDLASVSVCKPDPEIEALMHETAAAWSLTVKSHPNSSGCPTHNITCGSMRGMPRPNRNPLLTTLRTIVGAGTHFPHEYLTASREDRAKFLAGLLDTDGYLGTGCFEIIQKQRGFADGICFLARSLGLRATMSVKRVPGYDCPYWRVNLSGEMSWLPMRIPRKKPAPRRQVKDATRTGLTVEPIGVGDYAGFTLDGDHRFLLGDFTVTHNSSALQLLQLTLLGHKKPLILSKTREDDFGTMLLRSPIAYFDNTDSFIEWLPDAICAYTTTGMWTKRKLYTDMAEAQIKPHAFVAVASKNPSSFRREDTADRCVVIRLERRKAFTRQAEREAEVARRRGRLLGEYLTLVDKMAGLIRGGLLDALGDTSYRMADFAQMAYLAGNVLGWAKETIEGTLAALQAERDAFAIEGDPLVDLLSKWITYSTVHDGPNIGRKMTTMQLHHELTMINANGAELYKPSVLAQKLRSSNLEKHFVVESGPPLNGQPTFRIFRHGDARMSVVPEVTRPRLKIVREAVTGAPVRVPTE